MSRLPLLIFRSVGKRSRSTVKHTLKCWGRWGGAQCFTNQINPEADPGQGKSSTSFLVQVICLSGKAGRLTIQANFVERKKETFFYLGQLIALSTLQDGPGAPIFAEAVTDYILEGKLCSLDPDDLTDGVKDILEKVSTTFPLMQVLQLLQLCCIVYCVFNKDTCCMGSRLFKIFRMLIVKLKKLALYTTQYTAAPFTYFVRLGCHLQR